MQRGSIGLTVKQLSEVCTRRRPRATCKIRSRCEPTMCSQRHNALPAIDYDHIDGRSWQRQSKDPVNHLPMAYWAQRTAAYYGHCYLSKVPSLYGSEDRTSRTSSHMFEWSTVAYPRNRNVSLSGRHRNTYRPPIGLRRSPTNR